MYLKVDHDRLNDHRMPCSHLWVGIERTHHTEAAEAAEAAEPVGHDQVHQHDWWARQITNKRRQRSLLEGVSCRSGG
jgi:hypothetical protein